MSESIKADELIDFLFDKGYIFPCGTIDRYNWKIHSRVTFSTSEDENKSVCFLIYIEDDKYFVRKHNLRVVSLCLGLSEEDYSYIIENFSA